MPRVDRVVGFVGDCKNSLQIWSKSVENGKDRDVSEREAGGRWGRAAPRFAMLAGVLAWLWPIGLGGRMPVGGDATQFSMGLMAFLGSSLRAGRLPLWDDLWGFGFPGVAESQMGVFYPPHLLLYGFLPTETAYTASLVLHTLWGALGASWASRRLGTSESGAALAGFAWATCGFFLIHLPHQWGYTVGSWMPWAWGLAWQVGRGGGSRRTPWLLAAVLALQILPGHFQLAFVTEVGALVLVLIGGGRSIGRRVAVLLAIAGMIPLSAMQLWPTARLAGLTGSHRDFEYLSGFAATPIHLVNYVAPGLFHRSPLWRPLAWDPFHTSPEELLGYVGLVPLFLALGAILRGWRADPSVRALAVVAGATLALSLGPYAPGFGTLIRLPGFSFFRAPARWGLATNLALALLAGRGFDACSGWPRPGRSARRFAFASLVAVLVVVSGFELALVSWKEGRARSVASGFDRALRALPWADRPGSRPFRALMAEAYRPQTDLRTQSALARLEGKAPPSPGPTLADDRLAIYARELGETGALLAALLATSALAGRPRAFSAALATLALADALIQARHRPIDLGPARPLVEQSTVLARLAREPRGLRTLDPAQNLFLVAGSSPVAAYRTLDLPQPIGLLQLARGPIAEPRVAEALRASGVGIRVLDPWETRAFSRKALGGWAADVETIRDPALAGWLLGADFASGAGLQDFALLRARVEPARAWLLPSGGLIETDGMVDALALIEKLRSATPLDCRSEAPERAEVEVGAAGPGPSMVVLSKTFDPEWRAWWSSPSVSRRPARVVKMLGGWQGVEVPEPGRWTLHLEYSGRAVRVGLAVSSIAWSVWLVVYLRLGAGRASPVAGVVTIESEGVA
jgi:hypothetical protein